MDTQELRRLALIGAAARLAELERERLNLLRAFPGLRAGGGASPTAEQVAGPVRRRRRSRMSAEARQAVSQRMKRYWAERRSSTVSRKKSSRGAGSATKG